MALPNKVLILGDFNIHLCCPLKPHPLTTDFTELIDSFNLSQGVTVPTHSKGHTLDRVLTLGLSPGNLTTNLCVSNLIDVVLAPQCFTRGLSYCTHFCNSSSAVNFSQLFTSASLTTSNLYFSLE